MVKKKTKNRNALKRQNNHVKSNLDKQKQLLSYSTCKILFRLSSENKNILSDAKDTGTNVKAMTNHAVNKTEID